MKQILLILLFVLALIPVGIVAGQSSSANFVTKRFVVDAGDSTSSSSFSLTAVVGQATTDLANSSSFKVSGGFLTQRNSLPTSVALLPGASQSLLPFWIMIATGMTLLLATLVIHRRAASREMAT